MTARHFPIRVGRRSRPFLRLFGVRDAIAFVEWPGALHGHMPREPRARVLLEHAGGDQRRITVMIDG